MLRYTLVSSLITALFGLQAAAVQALELNVDVSGLKSTKGYVLAEIFSDNETWLKKSVASAREPAGAKVVLAFRDLPAGTYAVSLFHDENSNAKFDTNLMGMPTEPFGFSRDARGMMGPAKFNDAAIRLDADTRIQVTLQ